MEDELDNEFVAVNNISEEIKYIQMKTMKSSLYINNMIKESKIMNAKRMIDYYYKLNEELKLFFSFFWNNTNKF